ncbi:MAG: hypothetical protein JXR94_12825, partial [Candidatus Hydrogenedentes bacterium]|nr:hypothetical protein [Candidatus Hydrogenedentota bacterium]
LVDVYPTLMDMAGLPHPGGLDGHSLMPELTGAASERPDWVLSESHDSTCDTGHFMLRRGPWKYIALPGYEPLLFNIEDDPDEVRNAAVDSPEVARRMDALLREVVDYEAVDAKVKAYDRASFRAWREATLAEGTYRDLMARVFSGWDDLEPGDIEPWTDEEEARLLEWLEG